MEAMIDDHSFIDQQYTRTSIQEKSNRDRSESWSLDYYCAVFLPKVRTSVTLTRSPWKQYDILEEKEVLAR